MEEGEEEKGSGEFGGGDAGVLWRVSVRIVNRVKIWFIIRIMEA